MREGQNDKTTDDLSLVQQMVWKEKNRSALGCLSQRCRRDLLKARTISSCEGSKEGVGQCL